MANKTPKTLRDLYRRDRFITGPVDPELNQWLHNYRDSTPMAVVWRFLLVMNRPDWCCQVLHFAGAHTIPGPRHLFAHGLDFLLDRYRLDTRQAQDSQVRVLLASVIQTVQLFSIGWDGVSTAPGARAALQDRVLDTWRSRFEQNVRSYDQTPNRPKWLRVPIQLLMIGYFCLLTGPAWATCCGHLTPWYHQLHNCVWNFGHETLATDLNLCLMEWFHEHVPTWPRE
jgi:hypothetical protein